MVRLLLASTWTVRHCQNRWLIAWMQKDCCYRPNLAGSALAITLDLCGGAEESAEQQSEVEKQQALDNWFFEKHPEKPGNKRLKNLKR